MHDKLNLLKKIIKDQTINDRNTIFENKKLDERKLSLNSGNKL